MFFRNDTEFRDCFVGGNRLLAMTVILQGRSMFLSLRDPDRGRSNLVKRGRPRNLVTGNDAY